jgi:hypothetical protein
VRVSPYFATEQLLQSLHTAELRQSGFLNVLCGAPSADTRDALRDSGLRILRLSGYWPQAEAIERSRTHSLSRRYRRGARNERAGASRPGAAESIPPRRHCSPPVLSAPLNRTSLEYQLPRSNWGYHWTSENKLDGPLLNLTNCTGVLTDLTNCTGVTTGPLY